MQAISDRQLLDIWEQGLMQSSSRRALLLLSAAYSDMSIEDIEELSIGERDTRLLRLRESVFGQQLSSVLECPVCHTSLEIDFNIEEILMNSQPGPEKPLSLADSSYEVQFRLPNSRDLEAVSGCPDLSESRRVLVQRCLVSAHNTVGNISFDELPPEILDKIEDHMSESDPQADIQLSISCSFCGNIWQETLDIISYFWQEINSWAHRVLYQVHKLASAYGWSERDILALSPPRRQFYLDAVNG
jgi:hypothetical protein